jgi:hypothetical protein
VAHLGKHRRGADIEAELRAVGHSLGIKTLNLLMTRSVPIPSRGW